MIRHLLFTSLFYLVSCQLNFEEREIVFAVQTFQGNLVGDAEILLNDKTLGVSDSNGLLTVKLRLRANRQVKLNVNKLSGQNYYVPYQRFISTNALLSGRPLQVKLDFVKNSTGSTAALAL